MRNATHPFVVKVDAGVAVKLNPADRADTATATIAAAHVGAEGNCEPIEESTVSKILLVAVTQLVLTVVAVAAEMVKYPEQADWQFSGVAEFARQVAYCCAWTGLVKCVGTMTRAPKAISPNEVSTAINFFI
jgi:hypothetical protein